ncbi:MAG: hypothetical protein KIT22_09005 [Verrucomicrobiae bacterium]|nr:hypothetical protein [Verrucomicrobiae bacterium]
MRPIPPPSSPDAGRRPMPPWLRITGTVVLGLILAFPVLVALVGREGAIASRPQPGDAAKAKAPAGVLELADDIAETAQHAIQVLAVAAQGAAEASVIEQLREIESALLPAKSAFEALTASAREPVSRIARELEPDWTAAANRVVNLPGTSLELKALTREITLDLKTFALGGYRVEEALEALCGRAMAALDSFRLGTARAGDTARLLQQSAQRASVLQPAHDSLSAPDRARIADSAQRLLQEFSDLSAAAALSPQWSAELRDATTELLDQLAVFTK